MQVIGRLILGDFLFFFSVVGLLLLFGILHLSKIFPLPGYSGKKSCNEDRIGNQVI